MGFSEYDKDEDGYYVSLTLLSQSGDLRLMRDVIIPAELNVDARLSWERNREKSNQGDYCAVYARRIIHTHNKTTNRDHTITF